MTLLRRQLSLVLNGRLDRAQLDDLCANLALAVLAEPTEPVGTELARRREQNTRYPRVTEMVMTITRSGEHAWTLTLDAAPGDAVDRWKCMAELGCRASALTVVDRRMPELPSRISQAERDTITGRAERLTAEVWRDLGTGSRFEEPTWESLGLASPQLFEKFADMEANQILPRPIVATREEIDVDELLALVREVRSLIWSWRADDPEPFRVLGWEPVDVSDGAIVFDPNLGLPNGVMPCDSGYVLAIDVPIARIPGDSPEQIQSVFGRMESVLAGEFGVPGERISELAVGLRWEVSGIILALMVDSPIIRVIFGAPEAFLVE